MSLSTLVPPAPASPVLDSIKKKILSSFDVFNDQLHQHLVLFLNECDPAFLDRILWMRQNGKELNILKLKGWRSTLKASITAAKKKVHRDEDGAETKVTDVERDVALIFEAALVLLVTSHGGFIALANVNEFARAYPDLPRCPESVMIEMFHFANYMRACNMVMIPRRKKARFLAICICLVRGRGSRCVLGSTELLEVKRFKQIYHRECHVAETRRPVGMRMELEDDDNDDGNELDIIRFLTRPSDTDADMIDSTDSSATDFDAEDDLFRRLL